MADLVEIRELALVALQRADAAIGKGKDQVLGDLHDRLSRGEVVIPIRDKGRHLRALKLYVDAADGLSQAKETAPDGFGFGRIDLDDSRVRAAWTYERLCSAITFGDLHAALQGSYASDEVRDAIRALESSMRGFDEPDAEPGFRP